jgi:8-oxo-dGTP pyrophosphatase MutT (NUDIX family)
MATEYKDGRRVLRRIAARVVLISRGSLVLLVHGRNPHNPAAGSWWFPPGGGCEPQETLEQAARRELYEESGIEDFSLGPRMWTRSVELPYMKDQYLYQSEHYFVGHTDVVELKPTAWTEEEQQQLLDMRWWTVPELLSTKETILPPALPGLLPGVITGEYPDEPLHLDQ